MQLTADPPRRLSYVPSDYESRKQLWIRSGLWLSFNEGPFVTLGVESLGYAERNSLNGKSASRPSRMIEHIERNLKA